MKHEIQTKEPEPKPQPSTWRRWAPPLTALAVGLTCLWAAAFIAADPPTTPGRRSPGTAVGLYGGAGLGLVWMSLKTMFEILRGRSGRTDSEA